jgi:hypothetical protein
MASKGPKTVASIPSRVYVFPNSTCMNLRSLQSFHDISVRNFALLLSSTMATTNSQDNRHLYSHVRDLAVELLLHPTLDLNSDDLATNNIEVVAMDIRTGIPADSGPQFCDLYPCREFDAMFKMVDEWPRRKGPGGSCAAL